ncbi:MAG: ABC transporter ATP-binding protein [Anaerolineales bacterium]|nr:ABC transporter ATP-binding protein [Anaerolineales bacterium]MCX7755662.1 ABC transporter ATP-binding protein [Anaerolineales bacterium]MDW8278966.1 ABC transporter ATP-binding protein [Anaerolineales bacterium]
MSVIIEIEHLTKRFGKRIAVDDLSLTVHPGEIFGLVGPNGAGKTTTMRMLATLLQPDSGEIRVGGHSVQRQPREVRRMLGYMPDSFGVYGDMSVQEYLDFFGACYKIAPAKRAALIADLLELVEIGHRRDDMVDTLSTGLKQRLGLARVLIHDPEVLVLDEPASGLDPRARIEIRELLREIARLGKTILFSSHILADVSQLCTRVAILESGKVVALGSLEQLNNRLIPHRILHLGLLKTVDPAQAQRTISKLAGIRDLRPLEGLRNSEWIAFEAEFEGDDSALHGLLRDLLAHGLPLVQFHEDTQTLEEVFLRATKGIVS